MAGFTPYLRRFIAQRLSHYVKGMGSDQVTTRLMSGELVLSDVELSLDALQDTLLGTVPYTLDIRRILVKSVSIKMPWQALRKQPVNVEVKGCEVEVRVHRAKEEGWLETQLEVQRKKAKGMAPSDEELQEEEDEKAQQRDVEAKLRVGLKEVVVDGCLITVSGVRVVISSNLEVHGATAVGPQQAWDAQDLETPKKNSSGEALAAGLPTATAVPVLALSLDTFTSVPCTALGARVERPEDVYQIGEQASCVRLYRRVEVCGLKLRAVGPLGTSHTLLEHVHSETGSPCAVSVWVDQQRLAGFIPGHKARRVCPYSSEVVLGVCLQTVRLSLRESQLSAVAAIAADATSPPIIPLLALPERLQQLHWDYSPQRTQESGAPAAVPPVPPIASSKSSYGSGWSSPDGRDPWPSPAAALLASAPGGNAGAAVASQTSASSSAELQGPASRKGSTEATEAQGIERLTSPGAAGGEAGVSAATPAGEYFTWSGPKPAPSSSAGLETREKLVNKRLCRRATAHVKVQRMTVELTTESSPGSNVFVCVNAHDVAFCSDGLTPLQVFERRCLAELNLLPQGNGSSCSSTAPPPLQRRVTGRNYLSTEDAKEYRSAAQQPKITINHLSIAKANVGWKGVDGDETENGKADGDPSSRLDGLSALLVLEVPAGASQSTINFHWKECPAVAQQTAQVLPAGGGSEADLAVASGSKADVDRGWQPVEGCIHGVRLYVEQQPLQALAELGKRVSAVATECLILPPFEMPGWCRISTHAIEVVVPVPLPPASSSQDAGIVADGKSHQRLPNSSGSGSSDAAAAGAQSGTSSSAGVLVSIPSILVTNVPGFGEILTALEALPRAPRWMPPAELSLSTPRPSAASSTSRSREARRLSSSSCTGDDGIAKASKDVSALADGSFAPDEEQEAPIDPKRSTLTKQIDGLVVALRGALQIAAGAAPCACGYELSDGVVHLGKDFQPLRPALDSCMPGRPARGCRQVGVNYSAEIRGFEALQDSDHVIVARQDFLDLARTNLAAAALQSLKPKLEELHAEKPALPGEPVATEALGALEEDGVYMEEGDKLRSGEVSTPVGDGDEAPAQPDSPTTPEMTMTQSTSMTPSTSLPPPTPSTARKRGRTLKLFRLGSGGQHSSSGEKSERMERRKSAGKDVSTDLDSRAAKLAARWAELEETVRRLRAERDELGFRQSALRTAAAEEAGWQQRCLSESERGLAAKLARQRAEQAELAVKAREQQAVIDKLLRCAPAQRDRSYEVVA